MLLLLGLAGGLSMVLAIWLPSLRSFMVFCTLLSIFHVTEFLFAAVYHTYTCSTESFLIPHSRAYTIAMGVSCLEFFVEWIFVGMTYQSMFWIGLCICVGGQILRWAAFVQAGHNFTHIVSHQKQSKHVLVTGGDY